MGVIAQFIFKNAYDMTTSAMSMTARQRTNAFYIAGGSMLGIIIYTLLIAGMWLFTDPIAKSIATRSRRRKLKNEDVDSDMTQTQSELDGLYDTTISSTIPQTLTLSVGIAAAGLSAAASTASTFVSISSAVLPVYIALGAAVAIGTAYNAGYAYVIPFVQQVLQCDFYRIIHHVFHPVIYIFVLVYQTLYGGAVFVLSLLQFFPPTGLGWLRYVFAVALPSIGEIFGTLGRAFFELVYGLAFFVILNPLFSEPPLYGFFKAVLELAPILRRRILIPLCAALDVLVGGIIQAIDSRDLALALDYAVRFAWKLPTETVVVPLVTLTRPTVDQSYERLTNATNGVGRFAQGALIVILAEWTDERLPFIVNGTDPTPTDGFQYLVRFLRSRWAETFTETFNAVAGLAFDILELIFNADIVVTFAGIQYWKMPRLERHLVQAIRNLGTIINTLPTCDNAFATGVRFGDIVALLEALFYLWSSARDIVVGELYETIFNGRPFGFYLALFLQFEQSSLQRYETALNLGFRSAACVFGFIDQYLATAIDSTATTVFFYLPRIPIELLAYVRYVLQTRQVNILDAVSIEDLRQRLQSIAGIGQLFFQFEQGASETTCAARPTFFCSLGLAVKNFVLALFEAFIVAIRAIVNIVKTFLTLVFFQSVSTFVAPDFSAVVDAVDTVGCRGGIVVATFTPFNFPCAMNRPNFCRTRQFPVVQNALGPCLATTACTIGRVIVSPVRLVVRFFNIITSFRQVSDSTLAFIKVAFDFLIDDLLPPLCPIAHAADCALAAFIPGLQGLQPTTDFVCVSLAILITVIRSITALIVDLVKLLFRVIGFFTNPNLEGNPVTTFFSLVFEAFRILAVSLFDIIKRLVGFVLYGFVVVLYGICKFFNLTSDKAEIDAPINPAQPRPCDSIRELLLGLGTAGFNFPTDPGNYKKRAAWEKLQAPGAGQRCYAMPFARTLFRLMYPDMSASFENITTCPDAESTEASASRRIYQVMGEGPRTGEERVRYLYERVAWTPHTRCARIIFAYRNTDWTRVPPESQATIQECAERVLTVAAVQGAYNNTAGWLPLDILYNDLRKYVMAGHGAMFTLAALQWTLDREQPLSVLINESYTRQWSSFGLYTGHYARWRAMYPGPGAPAYLLSPIVSSVRGRTLMQHLRDSFPKVFDPSDTSAPTLEALMQGLYESTTELLAGTAADHYARSQMIIQANESAQLQEAFYNDTSSYVRDAYGSRADSEFRERLATIAFYEALAKAYAILYDAAGELRGVWYEQEPNFKRSVEGMSRLARIAWHDALDEVDPEIDASWKRAKRDISEHTVQRALDIDAAASRPVATEEERMQRRFAQTVAGFTKSVVATYAHVDHAEKLCPENVRGDACLVWLRRQAPDEMGFDVKNGSMRHVSTWRKRDATARPPWEPAEEARGMDTAATNTTAWGFFSQMFSARTPYTRSRRALWNAGWASAGTLVWNTYYTLFGDETLTMQARTHRVTTRTAPSFDETLARARTQHAQQAREDVYASYARWRASSPTTDPKATQQQADAFTKAAFSKAGWAPVMGETEVDPRTGHVRMAGATLERGSFTYYRHLFSHNVREALDAEADRQSIATAVTNSRNHHGRPVAVSPRSAAVRAEYGLPPADRDDPTAESLWIIAEHDVGYQIVVPRVSRPAGMSARSFVAQHRLLNATFIFGNSSDVLSLPCVSPFSDLCEFCYLADVAVGVVINRALFTYYYYTTDYVSFLGQTIPFIAYTFDVQPGTAAINVNLTVVRSGNLTNGPWWFDRREPVGTYFQWAPNEVNEGLDPARWIRVALQGAPLPTLARGPLYDTIRAYIETPGGRTRPLYDILWLLETIIGIPIISLIDTVETYFETTGGDLISWLFNKVEACAYTPPQQIYSWSGGLFITLLYFVGATLVAALVSNLVYPGATVVVVGLALTLFIPLHITITYQGWNVFCVLPPPRYVWDAWRFFAYTLVNKCNGLIGLYITNADYDASTCAACTNVPRWKVVDCEAIGFVNVWDSLGYLETWLGGNYVEGIRTAYTTLYSLSIFFDADVSTSRDWTRLEPIWDADRAAYRNYGTCAVQTLVPYALGTLFVGALVTVFVASLLPNLPTLLFTAASFVVQLLVMTTFMTADMERRWDQLATI